MRNILRFGGWQWVGAWLLLAATPGTARPEEKASEWKELSREPNLVIYTRERKGSSVKEVKAVGTFAAPNWVVKNVLDDTDHYSEFMPHMDESRIIARDAARHTVVAYAVLNPPMISKRDYAVLVYDESRKEGGEAVYRMRWEPATGAKVPAEKKDVVRIKVNEGSWLLESAEGGQKTRGTYQLFTDGGGGVPAWVINSLNKKRLTELFETVGKRAQDAQYQKTKPTLP